MRLSSSTRVWIGRAWRWGVGAWAVAFACVSYTAVMSPDVRPLRTGRPASTAFMDLRVRQAAGKPVKRDQRWVSYRQFSPALTRAVVLTEDGTFWSHDGMDYDELSASFDWSRLRMTRGASTITMQLAKNLYLGPSQNPYRKYQELIITRRLEAELSKTRILELYLNVAEWGDGIWGAEAAARTYFGRPASDLSNAQAALLAGALINARVYSPGKPNARLLRRQQIILRRMERQGSGKPSASGTSGTSGTSGASGTTSSEPADSLDDGDLEE